VHPPGGPNNQAGTRQITDTIAVAAGDDWEDDTFPPPKILGQAKIDDPLQR
jgi:hypothetical protein